MLHTRLIVGSILAALTAGMLLLDRHFAPWFPFLFAVVIGLSTVGTIELLRLLPPGRPPRLAVCLPGVAAVVVLNWLPLLFGRATPAVGLNWIVQGFAAT